MSSTFQDSLSISSKQFGLSISSTPEIRPSLNRVESIFQLRLRRKRYARKINAHPEQLWLLFTAEVPHTPFPFKFLNRQALKGPRTSSIL